ncbi:hypothetical protein [Micromonospora sp. ATCC 39149]|uniref:hypothetical protein n=1 Tax=Micromonospora sp. (strain ATCC 39149 / NRRL 15099 / SCC 1413) TaxID=219305 RepID=UPI0002EC9276|nr:hypothetical protein [Micromonospora sp. ATCC 39149]
MTTTDATPTADLDLDAIRAREQAATPGPWGWRGHISQSVELRALHSGGLRIISTSRPEPCIGYTADEELVLLDNACKACTAYLTGGGIGRGEDPKCEKPENLDTVWTWHPDGFIRPINEWAKAEVLQWSQHMYRDDVKGTTHPDAEFIAHARQDIPALLAEVDRLRAAQATAPGQAEPLTADVDVALTGPMTTTEPSTVAYSHSPEANVVLTAAGSLDGRLPFAASLPEQIARPLAELLQNIGDAMHDDWAGEVEHPNHIPSKRWLVHPDSDRDRPDREHWTDALRLARALLGRPDPNAAEAVSR